LIKNSLSILVIPAPQRMKTNLNTEQLDSEHTSVRRLNNEPVNFKCIIEPNRTNSLRRPKYVGNLVKMVSNLLDYLLECII
jgi:hypothetical protein